MEIYEMKDYGIQELENNINKIVREKPLDIDSLTDLTFENAKINGMLTHTYQEALEDICYNYDVNTIFQELSDMGYNDMKEAAEYLDTGKIHLLISEREFEKYLNEVYEGKFIDNINDKPEIVDAWYKNLSDQDKIFAVVLEVVERNNLNINFKDVPELKKVQEKMQKIENKVINGLDNDQDINSSHKEPIKKYELTDETFEFKTNQKSQKKPMLEMSKPTGKGFER